MCVACEIGMRRFAASLSPTRSSIETSMIFAAGDGAAGASRAPRLNVGVQRADLIFEHANVLTMNSALLRAQAIAVTDGRIIAVGDSQELRGLKDAHTRVVDLSGRTVMPGFIDPHMHFSMVVLDDFTDVSAQRAPTIAALQAILREQADRSPDGVWVRAKRYDPSIMAEGRGPTLSELDEAVPDRPIFVLEANGHVAYVNSAAFKLANVGEDTPDPPRGRFSRESDGGLSGRLEEGAAMGPFIARMPVVSETENTMRAMKVAKLAAGVGCTMVHDCGIGLVAGPAELNRLQTIAQQGSPVRIRGMLVTTLAEAWNKMGLKPGIGDDRFRVSGMKAWSDGSNQARTGYQREPYLGTDSRGALNYTPDQLTAAIQAAHAAGWQVGVHANGDAAIDVTIEAYRRVLAASPRADHRHRIEHCSLLHHDQIATMRQLGLSPSFLIGHVRVWGKVFRDRILGPERVRFYDPCKSAIDGGLRISIHSDFDVTPIEPLQMVETAVTRVMAEGGQTLVPEERITREQAFRSITIDAAWQLGEERNAGSIEVGKFADLVVLDEDPFEVDADRISKTPVVETWLGGVRQD